MKVKSLILKEEEIVEKYSIDNIKAIIDKFEGKHIHSEPPSRKIENVVGFSDDSYYVDGEGLFIESEIKEGYPSNLNITCSLLVDVSTDEVYDVHSLYLNKE